MLLSLLMPYFTPIFEVSYTLVSGAGSVLLRGPNAGWAPGDVEANMSQGIFGHAARLREGPYFSKICMEMCAGMFRTILAVHKHDVHHPPPTWRKPRNVAPRAGSSVGAVCCLLGFGTIPRRRTGTTPFANLFEKGSTVVFGSKLVFGISAWVSGFPRWYQNFHWVFAFRFGFRISALCLGIPMSS